MLSHRYLCIIIVWGKFFSPLAEENTMFSLTMLTMQELLHGLYRAMPGFAVALIACVIGHQYIHHFITQEVLNGWRSTKSVQTYRRVVDAVLVMALLIAILQVGYYTTLYASH